MAYMSDNPGPLSRDDVEKTLKALVVKHLNLDLDPEQIDIDEEDFLTNRGFNSIDALELLISVEQAFGIQIDDEDLDASLLRTLGVLSRYVATAIEKRQTT